MKQNESKESQLENKLPLGSYCLEKSLFHRLKRRSKLATVIFSMSLLSVPTFAMAQDISLMVKNASLEQVLKEIRKQSGYNFFLNAELLNQSKNVTLNTKNKPIGYVLDEVFKQLPLDYKIDGKSILVQPKKVNLQSNYQVHNAIQQTVLGGRVTDDATGKYIAGATVQALPSGTRIMTDEKGVFKLDLKEGDTRILVSYLGMESKTVNIPNFNFIEIKLKAIQTEIDNVVVTGLFNKSKESFTGASQSFTGEQLKAVSPTSVLEAISMLTPGMVTVTQNREGSNPNKLPDLLLRGVTSFTNTDQSVNQPLIVRDGTIVSLQDLYDMDINEIETVTVLKDASAAALYGARAANGVIVIERKRVAEGKIRVAYNLISSVQMPDFSDYNLLDPMQKLEYEKLAGLYTSADPVAQYGLDSVYNNRFKMIRSGVQTDWMAQPSRVGFTNDHSVRVSGGSQGTRYELNGRFAQVNGVMKGDGRDRYGFGFMIEHYAAKGFSFTNRTTFNRVNSVASPYGAFSNFIQLNPYDAIYDEYGQMNKLLSWEKANPLYEASLGSFDRNWTQLISNDFDARWNINSNFRLTTHWNISLNQGNIEGFLSPLSAAYKDETDPSKKGMLNESNSKGLNYSGNLVLSYNKIFKEDNLLAINTGATINRFDNRSSTFMGIGFYADNLSFMKFAASYPDGQQPTGVQDLSTDLSGFFNVNYSLKNRYYVDGVYQMSGSSKFGVNNRYGHFWSTGLGWNLHNESFMNADVINLLKLRGSMGYTGKVNFASYQSLTTYQYRNELAYLNGIGAVPIAIGNPDLKWERTMNYNAGVDMSLWNRRVNFTADVYVRRTTDLLIDKTLAPSTGVTTGKDNLGEMENRGIELRADVFAVRNEKWSWQLGTNLQHNRNKILKISNSLQRLNDQNNSVESGSPLPQFIEGESTTSLKVVPSGGIDAATGQEIFIKRNGERTFIYDPYDKIVVGDQTPVVSGNVFTTVRYKRLSAVAYFGFTNGGYIYNMTRATKVEGSNPMFNADVRVLTDRWQKPGDIAQYRNIADATSPKSSTRFVEKENTVSLDRLNIAYDFSNTFAKRLGANKLSFGMSINDLFRLSTVRMERGTNYLYSRGVDFNINILF